MLSYEILNKIKHLDVDDMLDMEAGELGEICRHRSMGPKIQQMARQIPRLYVTAAIQPITREVGEEEKEKKGRKLLYLIFFSFH